jgi:hypothetical protein
MTDWLHLFTWNTWQEFLDIGGQLTGFRASRWKTVQKIQPGDMFLCYMIGISRFFAILEVTDTPYQDERPLWSEVAVPCRVPVRIVMDLPPEFAVPVKALGHSLSYFQNQSHPNAWAGHFRQSPQVIALEDATLIRQALEEAVDNPVFLEYDRQHLERSRIPVYESTSGGVTVPENTPDAVLPVAMPASLEGVSEKSNPSHEEIQWRLLNLGSQMGLQVWVARNDRSRVFNAQMFKDVPRMRTELPAQFDEATQRTIELIDVLWLKGNAIVAAFEVEHTSSVYSGLLRMADLVSMHPNINIELYIVAPDHRRDKVRTEINRPTFSRLTPPLKDICRFIPYSSLVLRLNQLGDMLRYIRPEFLDEIAETLDVDMV